MSSERRRNADEVFCRSCGERIAARAEVCPHCGVRNERYRAGSTTARSDGDGSTTGETDLDTNVAAALSYVLWFVSGIAVYVLEDDDFVRFHAAQSIAVFGGISVANVLVGMLALGVFGYVGTTLSGLLSLVALGLWVFLIVTAYRGETRRIPVAADIADRLVEGSDGTTRTRSTEPNHETTTEDDALATLRSRYARGEIGDTEFERRLERLLESEDDENQRHRSRETEHSW